MDVVLWVAAGLLAAVFLMAGMMKAIRPYEEVHERMDWVGDFSPGTIKLIGSLEVAGAIGLVLPPLLDIVPVLAPLAAVGLAMAMLGAAATHARRGGEVQMLAGNVVLLALAVFVAVGRFAIEPF